jgi:hypothetical protein
VVLLGEEPERAQDLLEGDRANDHPLDELGGRSGRW